MSTAPTRKYALTKVSAGDYLLPSNDRTTIWRISSYEDGPSNGLNIPKDRTFWGLWRWHRPVEIGSFIDVEDWDRWTQVEDLLETRTAAINSAMAKDNA